MEALKIGAYDHFALAARCAPRQTERLLRLLRLAVGRCEERIVTEVVAHMSEARALTRSAMVSPPWWSASGATSSTRTRCVAISIRGRGWRPNVRIKRMITCQRKTNQCSNMIESSHMPDQKLTSSALLECRSFLPLICELDGLAIPTNCARRRTAASKKCERKNIRSRSFTQRSREI